MSFILAGLALFLLGLWLGSSATEGNAPIMNAPLSQETETWYCAMDPSVRQPQPGSCPLCGMDLVPMEGDREPGETPRLRLSTRAQSLAGIRTAPVVRKTLTREIPMAGTIVYNEEQIRLVPALIAGMIERSRVNFKGIAVEKGEAVMTFFSPEMLTGQRIFLEAAEAMGDRPAGVRSAASLRLQAAEEKLRSWGLTEADIEAIKATNQPSDSYVVKAPISGTVIEVHARKGDFVQVGTPLFTIADLSSVWLELEAYESDLSWLRFGEEVVFETGALPGERFSGRLVYIDSEIDSDTRTARVRLAVPNADGRLRREMFARAIVRATWPPKPIPIPELEGKWIGPRHPDIVKDQPGYCEICGLPLVPAHRIAWPEDSVAEPPLVIPASAPLYTGERAVVYVSVPGEIGLFEGREIAMGPSSGEEVVVTQGLQEGEMVVVNGVFKIDSELQIRAKRSMMYPDSESVQAPSEEAPLPAFVTDSGFRTAMGRVLDAYFTIQTGLSQDQLNPAIRGAFQMGVFLGRVDSSRLNEEARSVWEREAAHLAQTLKKFGEIKDLVAARERFEPLSDQLYRLVLQFGAGGSQSIFRFHCPMAFDHRGASWLQNHEQTANPYFGSAMYRCGSKTAALPAKPSDSL